jgi:hypothetical protein
MKKKIQFLIAFIKSLKCEEFSISFEIDYNEVQYMNEPYCKGKSGLSLPSNVESIVEEIINHYADELYELGPGSAGDTSASDYFNVELAFNPEENKLFFNEITHTEYDTEDNSMSYDINDYEEDDGMYSTFMEVRKFLEHEGIEDMTISYNGSGDSGYIESDYTSKNKNGQIDEDIEHICYDLLEEYGGWEINEGSQGTIYFTKDEIEINHEWNTEESYTSDEIIEVKPEDFND